MASESAVISAQFMEKFNELKELVNASVHASTTAAAEKQSNGADITDKQEFTQQPSVSHIRFAGFLFFFKCISRETSCDEMKVK